MSRNYRIYQGKFVYYAFDPCCSKGVFRRYFFVRAVNVPPLRRTAT